MMFSLEFEFEFEYEFGEREKSIWVWLTNRVDRADIYIQDASSMEKTEIHKT